MTHMRARPHHCDIQEEPNQSNKMDQTADLRPQMESLSVHINLLGLNDDCLIAILRLLPVHDLDSIASTCIRLKAIARAAFKLRPMAKRSFNFPELLKYMDYGA